MTETTLKINNQENGISSEDLDTGLLILSAMDTTYMLKIRPQEEKVMQCQGHSTQITCGVLEHQHTIWQSQEVHQPPCQLTNHYAQQLKMNTLFM